MQTTKDIMIIVVGGIRMIDTLLENFIIVIIV